MPDTSFQSTAAATRRINAGEAASLQSFLGSDLSLDQFITDNSLNRDDVNKAISETGLTLPDSGFGSRFSNTELSIYTDILQGDQDFFTAATSAGLNPTAAASQIQDAGLRVPLQPGNRSVFDSAVSLGLTAEDATTQLGLDPEAVSSTLGAAGLSLPAKKTQVQNKSANRNLLEGAFSGVPQAPGVKLGFLNREGSSTIFSGPRGVTKSAPTRKNKLTGGVTL